jgi:hypothetical protein
MQARQQVRVTQMRTGHGLTQCLLLLLLLLCVCVLRRVHAHAAALPAQLL